MQVSINAIRQKSSSLAWRFISSNKINVDYSYPKVNCMNQHCISNKEMPALSDTLEENKLPLVKSMIKSSCNKFSFHTELKHHYPDTPDGVLALYDAVLANNSSLVRNLIKFDEVDVDYAFPPLHDSILHVASYNGCMDIVRILVEEGHASCYKNLLGTLPILCAAHNNHMDIVEYFSERSPETRALLEAVQQNNSSLVRSLIKSNKVDVNYVYLMEEYTVLHVAASEGSLEIVKILVEEGHAVSLPREFGHYPIHDAAKNGHIDVVLYLEGTGRSGVLPQEFSHMLLHAEKKL